MNHDPNEIQNGELDQARLTAHALDQLEGAERAAVEVLLAGSDRSRHTVEEIRALAAEVKSAAGGESLPRRSPELRVVLEQYLSNEEVSEMNAKPEPSSEKDSRHGRPRSRVIWAAAACALLAAIPGYVLISGSLHQDPRSVALEESHAPEASAQSGSADDAAAPTEPSREPAEAEVVMADAAAGDTSRQDGLGIPAEAESSEEEPGLRGQVSPRTAKVELAGGDRISLPVTEAGDRRYVREDVTPGMQAPKPLAKGVGSAGSKDNYGVAGRPSTARGSERKPAKGATSFSMEAQPAIPPADKEMDPSTHRHPPRGKAPAGPPPLRTLVEPLSEIESDSGMEMGGLGDSPLFGGMEKPDGKPRHSRSSPVLNKSPYVTRPRGTEQYDPIVENPAWFKKGSGTVVRSTLRAVPATVPDPFLNHAENPFLLAAEHPESTFSVDVDTASYANVRRFLNSGQLPPPNAVRIEELVNYFRYDYPQPDDEVPFSVNMETAGCPWETEHRLLRIGLAGREVDPEQRGPSNLVFLLDVSGSMREENKLPLVQYAMNILVDQLTEDDRVAIVTYAGNAGVALESTSGEKHKKIRRAVDHLAAGGSTHGSAGIVMAYDQAMQHFVTGGTNRVILCTDGDLNVGITSDDELVKLISKQATSGVFLTVLGFGTGNLKDSKMEKLADKGNGIYAYVDGRREARRVLVEQMTGSLVTIAKDVKIQIEFNPAEVKSYRLIGYENRVMAAKDFDNDKKDAGEIGAGHTVTALYEIVPGGGESGGELGRELKYQRKTGRELTEAATSGELLTLSLRYKEPEGKKSKLLQFEQEDSGKGFDRASADFRFASSVAAFGMLLRGSEHAGDLDWSAAEEIASGSLGEDPGGYRNEFLELVHRAGELGSQ